MNLTVLCYKKCSTCQKALKWLDANGISYVERPVREENPTLEELKEWYGMSGLSLKRFFNTSGNIYKEMSLKDKLPSMSEDEQLALLATALPICHGRDVGEKTAGGGGWLCAHWI